MTNKRTEKTEKVAKPKIKKKIVKKEPKIKKNNRNTTTPKVDNNTTKDNTVQAAPSVNNKTAGVLLSLFEMPDWFKEYIDNTMYYSADGINIDDPAVKGYSYMTAMGDPTSYIYYKVNGDTITYKRWMDTEQGVANGRLITKTVQLSRLVNDYYLNQEQKNEIADYVNKLKDPSEYGKNN